MNACVRLQARRGVPHFGTTLDVEGALRTVVVRPEDWPLQARQVYPGGDSKRTHWYVYIALLCMAVAIFHSRHTRYFLCLSFRLRVLARQLRPLCWVSMAVTSVSGVRCASLFWSHYPLLSSPSCQHAMPIACKSNRW